MRNVYFGLTEEFNAQGLTAVLASGQAVVFHRLAIMSKDGDWLLRETPEACAHVLAVLAGHGARYRPSAPLHPRWLAGGWSSHFEFADDRGRRIRCDFVSRAPRLDEDDRRDLFQQAAGRDALRVIDVERLIRIKQTQRAKDYPVIAELARLLPPERELELTTDPDRILALAAQGASLRPSAAAARSGGGRQAVVLALAAEVDALQQADRARMERYESAAAEYLQAFRERRLGALPLQEAHLRAVELAESLLPERV